MQNSKMKRRAMPIAIAAIGILAGAIGGSIIGSQTDPNREKVASLDKKIKKLEKEAKENKDKTRSVSAVMVSTPVHSAKQEQARLALQSSERHAGYLMGGLVVGALLGLGGAVVFSMKSGAAEARSETRDELHLQEV